MPPGTLARSPVAVQAATHALHDPGVPLSQVARGAVRRLASLANLGLPVRAGEALPRASIEALRDDMGILGRDIAPPSVESPISSPVDGIWRRVAHCGLSPVDVWVSNGAAGGDDRQYIAEGLTRWSDYLVAVRDGIFSSPNGPLTLVVQQHVTAVATGTATRTIKGHGLIQVTAMSAHPPRSEPICLSSYGRLVRPRLTAMLDRFQRHRLARLVRHAERTANSAVSMNWSLDRAGYLWINAMTPIASLARVRDTAPIVARHATA